MSEAQVTRAGLEGVKPPREARMWSGGQGASRQNGRRDHPGSSYYGQPVINPPVWEELDIAGYLFLGGLAGASSLLAAGGELTGRRTLARRSKLCASGAIATSLVALVHDLGRPARFINMMRVLKPTSPMSVGTWILAAYSPLNFAGTAAELTGIARPLGRAATVGAGALGPAVASYTAALVANTAVPAWHGGYPEMPFVFVGSAAGAGAGFAMLAAPLSESAPARRLAVLGAAGELVAEKLMERRLGMVAETLHTGTAGTRLTAAQLLTAAGALGAATVARRSRVAAALSGGALLAGSALTRFGIFAAGMASARDPKYTVAPQRARLVEPPKR
ncbi:MAG: NrfD/PsrC family molybdoenzyme membrane anchor subunit [Solirubrobacteraceae bacterium]